MVSTRSNIHLTRSGTLNDEKPLSYRPNAYIVAKEWRCVGVHSCFCTVHKVLADFRMAECDDEYYEMNFWKLNAVPFGVATINRNSLPWQLIVAESFTGSGHYCKLQDCTYPLSHSHVVKEP